MVVLWRRIRSIFLSLCLCIYFLTPTVESLPGCQDPQVQKYVQFDELFRNETHRVIHLRCAEHHASSSENISTCIYDVSSNQSKWLPEPSQYHCYAYCKYPNVTQLVTTHDFTENTVQRLHLECPQNYGSSGTSIIECAYDVTNQRTYWQPDPLDYRCHPPCSLQSLREGVVTSPDRKFIYDQDTVMFSCTQGMLLGPETSQCVEGQWEPPLTQRCDFDNGKLHLKDRRVLVRYKGVEGSVCSTEDWNIYSANVVCRQLGLRPYAVSISRIPFFDSGNDLIHFDSHRCEGYENMLVDCEMSLSACETKHYAGLICLDGDETASDWSVRLVNPLSEEPSSGRVEIYHQGRWDAVCIDDWTLQSGHVVCRQLGYPRAKNISKDNNQVEGGVLLDRFKCTGDEKSIQDCSHSTVKETCKIGTIGTVVCEHPEKHTLRLVNGTSSNVGRLEIFDGSHWRIVSDDFNDEITPKLICDELVEEGSYNTYATDGKFGNGLVAPKYSYVCPKTAVTLDECLVADVSSYVTDMQPISLYCDKVEVPPSTNPRLIFWLSFVSAVLLVAVGFAIRVWYHKKVSIVRRKSIISERYDHLTNESDETKVPMTARELSNMNDDAVFTD